MLRNKIFPGGVHVPSLTFFKDDARQEIDWELQEKHFKFLIESGLHGSMSSPQTRQDQDNQR